MIGALYFGQSWFAGNDQNDVPDSGVAVTSGHFLSIGLRIALSSLALAILRFIQS